MSDFETAVRTIQFLSADAVQQANSGHPGTPMALAGITTELFATTLRYNPKDSSWPNRDRFVLSCGHASMLLYSALHLAGYQVTLEDLKSFRQWGSKTPGHPEYGHTEGVETTTGPLGQGVSNAVGMALGAKLTAQRVGADLINYRVFALASDGDLMEGVASEAASLAGQWQLDNLVVIYDANNITIDGTADLAFSEDVGARFESYGWEVSHVDGHDPEAVRQAIGRAVAASRPALVVAKTHIGIGCPNKQDTSAAHGAPLGRDEINAAKRAAGWPEEEFRVPDGARSPFAARVEAVQAEYDRWQATFNGLSDDRRATWERFFGQRVPADILQQLLAAADDKEDATRASGSRIEQAAAALVPALISGSADLNASTKTDIKNGGYISAGEFSGRNLRYGIREHAMGSIANGLALSGLIPITSTFLIFSDYMRPPVRLASMMKQQAIYVYTHDSFFVGEDGPTHQPVEQIASLRLIPGVDVVRPADSLECAAAWAHALQRTEAPTVICLTRQKLPALSRGEDFRPEHMMRGGYVVKACAAPTLVIIATGSEVSVALGAAEQLEAEGQKVRVVSMPCVEAFERQSSEYQLSVLGRGVRRVAVEAGRTGLWGKWIGLDGIAVGMDRFGASAPAAVLQKEFGLTSEAVARRISERL